MKSKGVWNQVKIDYESGVKISEICMHYKISKASIYRKINSEKWMHKTSIEKELIKGVTDEVRPFLIQSTKEKIENIIDSHASLFKKARETIEIHFEAIFSNIENTTGADIKADVEKPRIDPKLIYLNRKLVETLETIVTMEREHYRLDEVNESTGSIDAFIQAIEKTVESCSVPTLQQ